MKILKRIFRHTEETKPHKPFYIFHVYDKEGLIFSEKLGNKHSLAYKKYRRRVDTFLKSTHDWVEFKEYPSSYSGKVIAIMIRKKDVKELRLIEL